MNKNVILIPTYNEYDNIQKIIPAILDVINIDIWVLDDNSPDKTGEIVEKLAENYNTVRITHRKKKEGLGRAYIDGFKQALDMGYEHILQMDADFSHPINVLPTLLEESKKFDIVLGSRWVKGGGTKNWSLTRQIISRLGSLYARLNLGLSIKDLTGGFKCWNRKVLQEIELDDIQCSGYGFQIEMTYRAIKKGYSVKEIPIIFTDRKVGYSKMSKRIVLEAIFQVPKLRFRA